MIGASLSDIHKQMQESQATLNMAGIQIRTPNECRSLDNGMGDGPLLASAGIADVSIRSKAIAALDDKLIPEPVVRVAEPFYMHCRRITDDTFVFDPGPVYIDAVKPVCAQVTSFVASLEVSRSLLCHCPHICLSPTSAHLLAVCHVSVR